MFEPVSLQNLRKLPDNKLEVKYRLFKTVGILAVLLFVLLVIYKTKPKTLPEKKVTSFAECKDSPASTVLQSSPEVCLTKDSKRFVQEVESPTVLAPTKTPKFAGWGGSVVGVIRTSGLNDLEKNKLGLKTSNFQLTQFNDKSFGFNGVSFDGLYLESDTDFKESVGKCINLTGNISVEYNSFVNPNYYVNGQPTYRRVPINVADAEVLKLDDCWFYSSVQKDSIKTENKDVLHLLGTITRTPRNVPDISEDYMVTLYVPLKNIDTGAGLQKEMKIFPIYSNDMVTIEKAVGRSLEFNATLEWGYAESRYLRVLVR